MTHFLSSPPFHWSSLPWPPEWNLRRLSSYSAYHTTHSLCALCFVRFQWCLRKIKKIYGAESEADNVFSWFFGTLGMQCFMFTKQPVCTKTKQICSGWLVQSCVEECVSYRYRYQAAQATIEQGEIILGKPWLLMIEIKHRCCSRNKWKQVYTCHKVYNCKLLSPRSYESKSILVGWNEAEAALPHPNPPF